MSHSFKNNLFGAYYAPSTVLGDVDMKYLPWAGKSRDRVNDLSKMPLSITKCVYV